MTTSVLITAHLSNEKEVRVAITGKSLLIGDEVYLLQDGEKMEVMVYDDIRITVEEREK